MHQVCWAPQTIIDLIFNTIGIQKKSYQKYIFSISRLGFDYPREIVVVHTVVDTFSISRRYVTKVLSQVKFLLEIQEVSSTVLANLCSQFIKKKFAGGAYTQTRITGFAAECSTIHCCRTRDIRRDVVKKNMSLEKNFQNLICILLKLLQLNYI